MSHVEENLSILIKLTGNQNRYQYFIGTICFLFWFNTTMLSFILGFLENKQLVSYYDAEKNETTVESMDYDICDWDKSTYTIVETYKYSWVIDLGIECKKIKVSLIGTLCSVGCLLGALTYSIFTKRFGQRKVILTANVVYMLTLLITIFVKGYVMYCFTCVICMTMCNIISYSVTVLLSEIVVKSKKSQFIACINSGLGIGGIFYVLMFIAFKNWKHVFIVSISIAFVLEIITYFFFIESLEGLLEKKDFEQFEKNIKFIAKFNGRIDIYNKEIGNIEYQKALRALKGESPIIQSNAKPIPDTPQTNIMEHHERINVRKSTINSTENDKEKPVENKLNNLQSPAIETMTYQTLQTPKPLITDTPMTHIAETPKTTHQDVSKADKKSKEIHLTPFSLLKYPSVRYTFLLFCLLWFCTSALYSGLTIGLKSLPGSIYLNSLLLFIAETPGYFVSGASMNNKHLGRKYSLMLFTGCFALMCLMMFILFNEETASVVFYLLTRFFVMSAFCIYYTYCLESYPLSIGQLAYGINGSCNSLGGIVIPFIIEYISRRTLYLVYAILGGACTVLMILLKETRGKQIPDQIKEIEIEMKTKGLSDIPDVVV